MRLLPFIFLSLALCGCRTKGDWAKQRAYQKGAESAHSEISKGILAYETFGYPAPWSLEFESKLKEKYKIETRTVAGCAVNDYIIGHAEGFNFVMDAEIEKRFGAKTIEELAENVRKDFEEKKNREDTIHPTERRVRNAIQHVLSEEEKKQITVTISEPGKVRIDGPEEIKEKIMVELFGKDYKQPKK